MVTEAILSALSNVLTFQHIQYLMIGVVTGLIVGVLPGLGCRPRTPSPRS